DLFLISSIEKPLGHDANVFVFCRSPLRESVDSAMDIRVVATIIILDRIDHRQRLLRGGCVVQIDERFGMDFLIEHREIAPHSFNVETRALCDYIRARRLEYRAHPTSSQVLSPGAGRSRLLKLAVSGSHFAVNRST